MEQLMQKDAHRIICHAIERVLPETAVKHALESIENAPSYLVAIGKAAWRMASAAAEVLGKNLIEGIVITKYGHSRGAIDRVRIYEAGHPLPDANGLMATRRALELADRLGEGDRLILLVSGGGSALFEALPEGLSLEELTDLNQKLLASGANIGQINTVRKHLSLVKGGRFALRCAPAQVVNIVLSDVIGDPLDVIASGPAHPDESRAEEALEILTQFGIEPGEQMRRILLRKTPGELSNVSAYVTGNVQLLCEGAAEMARQLGYVPAILTTTLDCEARDAGLFFAALARQIRAGESCFAPPCALIAGGETVVHLRGGGKGGRNQELALAASKGIAGLDDVLFFSVGSDGTDGPTDAAGGMVDGLFYRACCERNRSVERALEDNDAYPLLKEMGALIVTGPTGTNVNDLMVLLVK